MGRFGAQMKRIRMMFKETVTSLRRFTAMITRPQSNSTAGQILYNKWRNTHLMRVLQSIVINLWRACTRVTVVILCVCLCVYYHTNCYIPRLYVEIKVALNFLCHFLHMQCVHFVENALFRSYGDICWPPLPSLLFDRLSDRQNRQRWLLFKVTSVQI